MDKTNASLLPDDLEQISSSDDESMHSAHEDHNNEAEERSNLVKNTNPIDEQDADESLEDNQLDGNKSIDDNIKDDNQDRDKNKKDESDLHKNVDDSSIMDVDEDGGEDGGGAGAGDDDDAGNEVLETACDTEKVNENVSEKNNDQVEAEEDEEEEVAEEKEDDKSEQGDDNKDDEENTQNTENQEVEEVQMDSLNDSVRDKTIEDAHDALGDTNNTTTNDIGDNEDEDQRPDEDDSMNGSHQEETLENNDKENENDDDADATDKTTTTTTTKNKDNEDSTNVDDINEQQGMDEELTLLPDAEREISDADKQKAILAEKVSNENVCEVIDLDDDDDDENNESTQKQNNIDKDGLDSTADKININETIEADNENLSGPPKQGEIKEIQNEIGEQNCIECQTTKLCKYILLQNDELKYLCEMDCVKTFQTNNQTSEPPFTLCIRKVVIQQIIPPIGAEQKCTKCLETKVCRYQYKSNNNNDDDQFDYLCDDGCVEAVIESNREKYVVKRKRCLIEEIPETADLVECFNCHQMLKCRFSFKQDDDEQYVCTNDCFNALTKEQSDRFRAKRRSVRVRDLPKSIGSGSATISTESTTTSTTGLGIAIDSSVIDKPLVRSPADAAAARLDRENSFIRRCAQCQHQIVINEKTLQWETMDFCNEMCLSQYQNTIGSICTTCHAEVTLSSLGKYCVRFGYEIRQFCCASCLNEFKKALKTCSYCQKDMAKNVEGFLASINGQFKDFCSQTCLMNYDDIHNKKKKLNSGICSVCNNDKLVRVQIILDKREHPFCSNPCFSAFKFVNNIVPDQCSMCTKYFERKSDEAYTVYQSNNPSMFCSKLCMNFFIITQRAIVPCEWCKVKKYNFDMIQKNTPTNSTIMLCSLNCLSLCEVSINVQTMKKQTCDECSSITTPQYHLTMSDASLRNFCTYQCVMKFQSQFSNLAISFDAEVAATNSPVPTGLPKRIKNTTATLATASTSANQHLGKSQKSSSRQLRTIATTTASTSSSSSSTTSKLPVISSVTSLATRRSGRPLNMQPVVELEPLPYHLLKKTMPISALTKRGKGSSSSTRGTSPSSSSSATMMMMDDRSSTPPPPPPPAPPIVEIKTQILTIPPLPKEVSNKQTMCKPAMVSKEVSCRPSQTTIGVQTESHLEKRYLIPIPVPIYIPQPMHMYSMPFPVPVPIPLPIPVPVFIPTTRNSASGIMKEIKKIQDKMPTDPFEAELLMMAEMVAGDKKKSESDSDSDDDVPVVNDYGTETINETNSFGEDMLQMALKMAGEYEEPAVDLESAMTANTITPSNQHMAGGEEVPPDGGVGSMHHHQMLLMEHQRQMQSGRGRKRGSTAVQPRNNRVTPPAKRGRQRQDAPSVIAPPQPEPPREPIEKADANMCLKFTFGVNAWKQWVMTKNADLEKSSIKRKPFKSELLQLTADELNYSLCLFVKEVRKPNGSEYAPDTIYYLVLGIQQYLYENGRIDNIFTDPYYERFTDCLDDVAKKFSVLYNDSQYIVTRVEEEHLWECKQLGAHSPHVLLSTLMFFNTKHFNLTTVEEHMQLSFSHIMKHWKRNPNQVGASKLPGSRNVLLRFYPPQSSLDNNARKKKVYEQQENEENPLRCPVKLYEFYLSKCPESVKTRNDVFYLQPERSCVPDSPVWYSTQALGKESLCKMLHRVKMVKEINIALLTS